MTRFWTTQTQLATKLTFMPSASGLLQRQCACGQHTSAGGECEECKQKREGTLQRAAINPSPVHDVPPSVHEVLRSPGQPLDAATRTFMEPRFGHDFSSVQVQTNSPLTSQSKLQIGPVNDRFEYQASQLAEHIIRSHQSNEANPTSRLDFSNVRIHADAKAAESAEKVSALAYTVGHHIVFGAGQYAPGADTSRHLLAHELAHVAQQQNTQNYGVVQRQPKPTAPTPARSGSPSCTPRTGVTEYGCYCGAGSSCSGGLNCTPADELDACCQQHDIDYGSCTFGDRYNPLSSCYGITRRADAILCDCAHGLAGHYHGASEHYRLGVLAMFCSFADLFGSSSSQTAPVTSPVRVASTPPPQTAPASPGSRGITPSSSPREALEILHLALYIAGLIPELGVIPDAINTGLFLIEGDWVNAGISAVAMIPIFGEGAAVVGIGDRLALRVTGESVEHVGVESIVANIRAVRLGGAAESPRVFPWRLNPAGTPQRTVEEAVAIARRQGVHIPDYIDFFAVDVLPEGVYAEYAQLGDRLPDTPVYWREYFNRFEKIPVRIRRSILESDEAIVAVIAHEMHELNNLERLFTQTPDEMMLAGRLKQLTDMLHVEAWDEADRLVRVMRSTRL